MLNKLFNRTWISPLVALSFTAVGVSGMLMLLHIRVPGMKFMHEWMGVLMVAAGAVHLLLNWRLFTACLRSRAALAVLAAGAVICAALFFGAGNEPMRHGPPPPGFAGGPAPGHMEE